MIRWRQCSRGFLVLWMLVAGVLAVGVVFPLLRVGTGSRAVLLQGWIQWKWYRLLLKVLNIRVRCCGRAAEDAMLWVSNHVSWLDIVVLGAQRPMSFVAKSEVGGWPVVGFLARRNGTLLVRRGDADSTRRTAEAMAWLLRQRRAVMLFPEGTSSNGDGVLRFHSRLFQPAVLAGARVQPIALAYRGEARPSVPFVGDDAFLPHLWKVLATTRITVDLGFCHTLSAGTRDELARSSYCRIVEALGRLAEPNGSGAADQPYRNRFGRR